MATNLAIDDRLIDEAKRVGNHKTKKEAVTAALDEYIRWRKQLEILDHFGGELPVEEGLVGPDEKHRVRVLPDGRHFLEDLVEVPCFPAMHRESPIGQGQRALRDYRPLEPRQASYEMQAALVSRSALADRFESVRGKGTAVYDCC